jgi:hypothetical protein
MTVELEFKCEADIYCGRPGAFVCGCGCGKHVCYRHYEVIDGVGKCTRCRTLPASVSPIDAMRKKKEAEARREIDQRIIDRASHLVISHRSEKDDKGK